MSECGRAIFISEFAGFIGGTEKFIFESAKLLNKNGFKCHMVFSSKAEGFEEFAGAFESCGHFKSGEIPPGGLCEIKTMHRCESAEFLSFALEKYSPTLFVHDHRYYCPKGFKYYPLGRANCKRAYSGLLCGLCACALPPRHFKGGFFRTLKKNFIEMQKLNRVAMRYPKFAVLSDFMAGELAKNGVEKSRIKKIIPFADIPEGRAPKKSSEIFRILFAGQHVASKGLHLFIDALSKMKSDFRADILGRGSRTEFFKKLAKKHGVESRLNFRGFQTDMAQFYADADAVAMPSLWQEPFGLVGIEAMAGAKPVVGFDVGGISEWLKDGFNGILVKERDTASFARALDALAQNPILRKRLGENAKNFVQKNFSRENFLKSLLQTK